MHDFELIEKHIDTLPYMINFIISLIVFSICAYIVFKPDIKIKRRLNIFVKILLIVSFITLTMPTATLFNEQTTKKDTFEGVFKVTDSTTVDAKGVQKIIVEHKDTKQQFDYHGSNVKAGDIVKIKLKYDLNQDPSDIKLGKNILGDSPWVESSYTIKKVHP